MTKENEIKEFNESNVYTGLSKKGYGHTYFAKRDFKPGEEIMRGFGKLLDHQTAHCSVTIGIGKHYLPNKWTGRYWNHSCDPDCYMKTRKDGFPSLIALKKIKKDQELNFGYYMTELDWSKGVDELWIKCQCGTKNCKGKILSFSQLSEKEKSNLKSKKLISSYLLKLK